ncbi:outer membrane beta-barrel protein [Piscinibacter sakaiensis]|uniref:Outer membrane protein A n=1 Tax=Piscinibacter sakaiensis TaxID=1547922 RepID=A0A0K8NZ14_PISS1|nr:outer membrane beta-barrel protein [Piscinibacter sakaiensis]GAP35621.1 outer membrane protein A precursor [Piscinibacter sakaiensis]
MRSKPLVLSSSLRRPLAVAAALVGLGASLGLSAAHAEGLYIGGSAGGSHYKGQSVGGLETDRSKTGSKVFGGYQFTPNLALEGGYVDLGKFNSAAGDRKANGYYLDAVGTVPISGPWSAIGRVGVFGGKLSDSGIGSDRGTAAKVGAGIDYAIDKNLSVRGEWERYRFDALNTRANTDLYSVGVRYAF